MPALGESRRKGRIAYVGRRCVVFLIALTTIDISAGVIPEVKHPWYTSQLSESELNKAKRFIEPLTTLSDEQITELIPARKPFQGRVVMPEDKAQWTPLQPKHLIVGQVAFIPEERWPPTEKQTVTGPDGKVWTYECVKDKRGEFFYPGCYRDEIARTWFVDAALHLANIYHATGEKIYAHKAALIVARFAQIYPSYPISGSGASAGPKQFFSKEPYSVNTGKWHRSPVDYACDGCSFQPLVLVYDLIYPSGEIDEVSRQWKRNIRQEIEEGFFLDYCKLMMKYDKWYADKPTANDNLQPYKCQLMIAIGRTVGSPEIVHYAYDYLRMFIQTTFLVDGVFPESPDYHRQVIGNTCVAIDFMKGYSDPPGYTHPRTRRRFDAYDPQTDLPTLERAKQFLHEACYPDGHLMTVHDTYPKSRVGTSREQTVSRLWPAFGHAILGRGEGSSQMEAHLHFSSSYGHSHQDMLNFSLWAFGEELLPDIGYTYTYRTWATSSLGHNLVVVDGRSQQSGTPQLLVWSPVQKGFGMVQVKGEGCYSAASTYSRTLMLVEHDPSSAFVVDIFEVAGGNRHDWMAHGSADRDQTMLFDKPDKPFADSLATDGRIQIPGLKREELAEGKGSRCDVTDEISSLWGNIRHVRRVEGPGPWRATFAGMHDKDACLRLHLLAPTDSEVYFGEAPSIRRAQERASEIEKYMMPILSVRRKPKAAGRSPARGSVPSSLAGNASPSVSRFVAVWEPYRGQPWIGKVEVLYDSPRGLALSVKAGDVKYVILWTPDGGSGVTLPGGISFCGRGGCVRQEGQGQSVSLIGSGASYGSSGKELRINPIKPLALLDTLTEKDYDYLIVRAGTPFQLSEPVWGILSNPDGYRRALRLGRCMSQTGRLKIECPDGLGLAREGQKGWKETCFPARTFQGAISLEIVQRLDWAPPHSSSARNN